MGAENIKIGSCRVVFGGTDLGFTQGGVSFNIKVTAEPQTYFGTHPRYNYVAGHTEISAKLSLVELTTSTIKLLLPWSTQSGTTLSIQDIYGQKLRQYAKTLVLEPQDISQNAVRFPLALPLVDSAITFTPSEAQTIDVVFVALCKSRTDHTLIEFFEQ